ncbi:hypothetical protein BDR03DRAFT_127841 [Suillus americanus]|nr:hypothetical protein BDR03DRAFT_127841 [Suillus americanus]
MQLTLLASLAILCSAAFAAPPALRHDDRSLVQVAALDDVLDNVTVNALTKRDDLTQPSQDEIKSIQKAVDDLEALTAPDVAWYTAEPSSTPMS